MRVIAVYFGNMRVRDYYKGEVLERLDSVGQPGWKNGEGKVRRVEELVCGERRASVSAAVLSVDAGTISSKYTYLARSPRVRGCKGLEASSAIWSSVTTALLNDDGEEE
jgi:hypothetical protein